MRTDDGVDQLEVRTKYLVEPALGSLMTLAQRR